MTRVLLMTTWSYNDALIQSCVLPYIKMIRTHIKGPSEFYLVTYEQNFYKMSRATLKSQQKMLLEDGIKLLAIPYYKVGLQSLLIFIRTFLYLLITILFKRIKIIHVFCTPPGVMGYFLSLLTFTPLLIDSYEPHAESMVENGSWNSKSKIFKMLFYLEKRMSVRAKWLISATGNMIQYCKDKYNFTPRNFYVKPACVDLQVFNLTRKKQEKLLQELDLKGKIVCVYAGKFGGIYLDTEVFDFFNECIKKWGNSFRVLLLTSHSTDEVKEKCHKANIPYQVIVQKYVPFNEVADYIGLGDFAITPVKPVPSKRFCSPIKNGEYWALGLPVVIPQGISDDADIISQHHVGAILKKLDHSSYKEAIEKINDLLTNEQNTILAEKIHSIAKQYRGYHIADKIYNHIYSDL